MKSRTRQRAAIRGVLQKESRPMTAEEIHRLARQIIPSLGVSTVYRSIRCMVDEQELVGVDFPGQPPRYELPTRDLHSHFICSKCQSVFDLPDSPPLPPVPMPEGFQLGGCELVVFGICARCGDPRHQKETGEKDGPEK